MKSCLCEAHVCLRHCRLSTQGPPGERGERGEPGDEGYQVDGNHQMNVRPSGLVLRGLLFGLVGGWEGSVVPRCSAQVEADHTCRGGLRNSSE